MPHNLSLPLVTIALVAGLLFPPLSPYTAVYVELFALIGGLFLLSSRNWDIFGATPFRLVWLALLALIITLPFAYQTSDDLLFIAALAPVFLAPAAAMLLRDEPRFATPTTLAFLCLMGAIGALAIAVNDIFILQTLRAGGENNSIHFGGLSLIIGFMSLIGLAEGKSPWRMLFLLGPVLGTMVAVLSGSRGPVLAALILSIATAPFLIVWFWRETAFKFALIAAIGGLFIVGAQFDLYAVTRSANLLGDIAALFSPDRVIDGATQERMVYYQAGLDAFREAPIFGHGSGHIASATGPHMPEAFAYLRHPDHLHNDLADFAVIGGLFGIVALILLLAAPLFAWRNITAPSRRRAVLLGSIILTTGYFALGLTNAMFGILPQTALFGLLLGILVAMGDTTQSEA